VPSTLGVKHSWSRRQLTLHLLACARPQIELLASPIYVLRTSSLDKNKGIVVLNKSIELIKEEMAKYDRGEAKVKDGGEVRALFVCRLVVGAHCSMCLASYDACVATPWRSRDA
jgi:hypothetical protein